jgi:hypothetical protein
VAQPATTFEFIQCRIIPIPLSFLPRQPKSLIHRPGFAIYAFALFESAPTASSVGFSARGGDTAIVWQDECPDIPESQFLDTITTVDSTLSIVSVAVRCT